MKERINWIDWAKAMAITMVVFGHIPQAGDAFLLDYVCTFHMPLFMFLSGYLTKVRTARDEMHKLWRSLVLPYLVYNLLFYPYWLVRHLAEDHGQLSLWETVVRPVAGVLLLQTETPFSAVVNGVTWFLVALLIMRLVLLACHRTAHPQRWLSVAALVCVPLYVLNEYSLFTTSLTSIGLLKCMPFYVLGFLTRRHHLLDDIRLRRDALSAMACLGASLSGLLALTATDDFSLRMLLFYAVSLTATYGVVYFCKTLNSLAPVAVVTVSMGTLMIMGLHWMCIGVANELVERLLRMTTDIIYSTPAAVLLALLIVAAIYPLILWARRHCPLLLGQSR